MVGLSVPSHMLFLACMGYIAAFQIAYDMNSFLAMSKVWSCWLVVHATAHNLTNCALRWLLNICALAAALVYTIDWFDKTLPDPRRTK